MMGNMGDQPVIIYTEGTTRDRGRSAQQNNILAAKAVAEAVRTTLGPKGMDKMLVSPTGDVVITNDGATILAKLEVNHPTAKMIIQVAKSQEQQAGDGTTTAVVLAGELLAKAEALIDDVHPTVIARGYHAAAKVALTTLHGLARHVTATDEKMLLAVARTALVPKGSQEQAEHLATIAMRAARAVADGNVVDLANVIKLKKTGGSVRETELIEGVVLDKERLVDRMPARVDDPRIALVDVPLEIEKTEINAKISIRDPRQMEAFRAEEERILRELVTRVKASGANALFSQKGIDDAVADMLAKANIYAVRRVSEKDMKALARATGGRVVSDLKDLAAGDLGKAGRIEERKLGDERLTFVTGCVGARSVSILVRASTQQVADEVDRTLDDALGALRSVLEEGRVLPGAGASEIEMALALRKYAASVGGREQLAIHAFADAVEIIPRALATNAGHDAIDTIVDLRAAHERGERATGFDARTGKLTDALAAGIVDPLRVKRTAVQTAVDAATMVLRIDDVIASKPPPGK